MPRSSRSMPSSSTADPLERHATSSIANRCESASPVARACCRASDTMGDPEEGKPRRREQKRRRRRRDGLDARSRSRVAEPEETLRLEERVRRGSGARGLVVRARRPTSRCGGPVVPDEPTSTERARFPRVSHCRRLSGIASSCRNRGSPTSRCGGPIKRPRRALSSKPQRSPRRSALGARLLLIAGDRTAAGWVSFSVVSGSVYVSPDSCPRGAVRARRASHEHEYSLPTN